MNMIFWGTDVKSLHSSLKKLMLNRVLPKLTADRQGAIMLFWLHFRGAVLVLRVHHAATAKAKKKILNSVREVNDRRVLYNRVHAGKTKIWSRRRRARAQNCSSLSILDSETQYSVTR